MKPFYTFVFMNFIAIVKHALKKQGRKIYFLEDNMPMPKVTLWRRMNGMSDFSAQEQEKIKKLLDIK